MNSPCIVVHNLIGFCVEVSAKLIIYYENLSKHTQNNQLRFFWGKNYFIICQFVEILCDCVYIHIFFSIQNIGDTYTTEIRHLTFEDIVPNRTNLFRCEKQYLPFVCRTLRKIAFADYIANPCKRNWQRRILRIFGFQFKINW